MQQQQLSSNNKEIFGFIADLLCQHEFRLAQLEYFELHCKKFENLEENEHSHHDLYKKYTEILDETIDCKLLEKFSDEQIKGFYDDFGKNYELYKKIAQFQQTVDTLFSFTDFDTFKNNMLEYHQRLTKTLPKKEGEEEQKSKEPKKIDVKFDFEQFNQYYQLSKDDKCWEKILVPKTEDQGDIRVQKLTDILNIVRTEAVIENCSVQAVVNACNDIDVDTMKKKNPYIQEAFYIETKEDTNDKFSYFSYDMPMVGAKDMLVRAGIRKLNEKTQIVYQHSIELPEYPVKESHERTDLHRQIYVAEEGKNTRVVTISVQRKDTVDIPPMFFVMTLAKNLKRGMEYFSTSAKAQQELLDKKE